MWYITVTDELKDEYRVRKYMMPFTLKEFAIASLEKQLEPTDGTRTIKAEPVLY